MNYQDSIKNFLSTCSGRTADVSYELYELVNSIEQDQQSAAVKYICEIFRTTNNDKSNMITKSYYTEKQLKNIVHKIADKIDPYICEIIEKSSKNQVEVDDFYKNIWESIQGNSLCKTDKERALALLKLITNENIPYQSVGIGMSMEEKEFDSIIDQIEDTLDTTSFILNIHYDQDTQPASMIVDRLLALEDYKKQTVYMAALISLIEERVKDSIKDYIKTI